MFVFVLICHCLLPRPEHMKKRGERRKSIRRQSMRRRRVNVNEQFNMGGGGYPQGGGYPATSGYQP